MKERLQKLLAQAGYGSRRTAETLITAGRVCVNGEVVNELGARADPAIDRVEVDGTPLELSAERVVLMMHKPSGYTTTARDPHASRTVMDLLPAGLPPHVLPVGRLDRETSGLLLFTDDGELAHRLTHPRYKIEKEYLALVRGTPTEGALTQLRQGVVIEGKRTVPAEADIVEPPVGRTPVEGATWLRLVIHEGRKRQVRLMCAVVGHPVRALVRVRVGDVTLGSLREGHVRSLTARETTQLRRSLGL